MSGQPLNATTAGFCGKVPVLGDFVHENLATEFTDCWNEWLRAALAVSKEQLGGQWLERYMVSPIWHFALSAGSCGPDAMLGTMIPSVDKVGRHYPLILAMTTDQCPLVCREQSTWCDEFEEFILQTLEDGFDFQSWKSELKQQRFTLPQGSIFSYTKSKTAEKGQNWLLHGELSKDVMALMHHTLRQEFGGYSLWWTDGSEDIAPASLIAKGLPLISQYSSMIDGQWGARGWASKHLYSTKEPSV